MTATVFRVTLILKNGKNRPVRVEGQATRTPTGLEVRADLAPRCRAARTYTVTVPEE